MQVHAWFEWTCARCKHLPRLHNFVILKTSWRLMWVDLDQNNQFTSPQSHSINTVDTCDDNKVISCFSASCDALCGSVRPFTRLLRFLIEQAHCLVSVSTVSEVGMVLAADWRCKQDCRSIVCIKTIERFQQAIHFHHRTNALNSLVLEIRGNLV